MVRRTLTKQQKNAQTPGLCRSAVARFGLIDQSLEKKHARLL
jgi:hypothetical protein